MNSKDSASLDKHFAEATSREDFASRYVDYLTSLLKNLDFKVVAQIIDAVEQTGGKGKTIYVLGNGGSAAAASHFVNDIAVGMQAPGAKPFKAFALGDQLASVSALANDFGWDAIFTKQLDPVLESGDLVIALSVSGNSANVVEAVKLAKEKGALTIGCTGFDGGALASTCDVHLHIPTHKGEYGPVEDAFQILDHILYSYLKAKRRKKSP